MKASEIINGLENYILKYGDTEIDLAIQTPEGDVITADYSGCFKDLTEFIELNKI